MSELAINSVDDQIVILNTIELVTAIFRGPDSDGWAAIIESGLPELTARAPKAGGQFTVSIKKLQDEFSNSEKLSEIVDDLQTEFVRLFVAGRGGVVAPPYESCHQDDKATIMSDVTLAMRTRLNDAGLEISLSSNEPPDHITLELEYLYHLLSTGWADGNEALTKEAQLFSGQVMLPWVIRFGKALKAGEAHPVFAQSADLMVDLLKAVSA